MLSHYFCNGAIEHKTRCLVMGHYRYPCCAKNKRKCPVVIIISDMLMRTRGLRLFARGAPSRSLCRGGLPIPCGSLRCFGSARPSQAAGRSTQMMHKVHNTTSIMPFPAANAYCIAERFQPKELQSFLDLHYPQDPVVVEQHAADMLLLLDVPSPSSRIPPTTT
jgi:hypothetical protein